MKGKIIAIEHEGDNFFNVTIDCWSQFPAGKNIVMRTARDDEKIIALLNNMASSIESALKIKDLWLAEGRDYPENKTELVALSEMCGRFSECAKEYKIFKERWRNERIENKNKK